MLFGSSSRVVVTGPTGGVGVALLNELLSIGCDVVAVCRPGSPRIAALPKDERVRIVELDLEDYSDLAKEIGGKCDAMIHLAWSGTAGPARMDWRMQAQNVVHAVEAARAAAELGCDVFVGVGSQAEYGHVEGVMDPRGFCRPDTGYGSAKLAASEMTRALCGDAGVRHEWCRILSLYGPGDRAQSLVMDVLYTLIENKRPVCTPCDQIWDYIYGKDAARAIRLVAESGIDGETYLIASGHTRPLREFVCDIRDVVNPDAEIGFGERPYFPNQAMRLEADISNLTRDTGFVPQYDFKRGIRETLDWALEHPRD